MIAYSERCCFCCCCWSLWRCCRRCRCCFCYCLLTQFCCFRPNPHPLSLVTLSLATLSPMSFTFHIRFPNFRPLSIRNRIRYGGDNLQRIISNGRRCCLVRFSSKEKKSKTTNRMIHLDLEFGAFIYVHGVRSLCLCVCFVVGRNLFSLYVK